MSWQERLQEERNDLFVRISFLQRFTWCPQFRELKKHDRKLLKKQLKIMREYLYVLDERLGGVNARMGESGSGDRGGNGLVSLRGALRHNAEERRDRFDENGKR